MEIENIIICSGGILTLVGIIGSTIPDTGQLIADYCLMVGLPMIFGGCVYRSIKEMKLYP